MNKKRDTKVQTAIDQFVNSSAPIQFVGDFSPKSQREYAAQLKIAIVKTMINLATYCVLPIYVITPHTEISFGYLKIKRDFGIGSTIVVLNNYKQKTNNNAHRIILG